MDHHATTWHAVSKFGIYPDKNERASLESANWAQRILCVTNDAITFEKLDPAAMPGRSVGGSKKCFLANSKVLPGFSKVLPGSQIFCEITKGGPFAYLKLGKLQLESKSSNSNLENHNSNLKVSTQTWKVSTQI